MLGMLGHARFTHLADGKKGEGGGHETDIYNIRGSQWRQSHFSLPVLPFFSLLASFVSSHLLRDSLCTALQTRRLWI